MTPRFRRIGYALIALNLVTAFLCKSQGDVEVAIWNVVCAALVAIAIAFSPRTRP